MPPFNPLNDLAKTLKEDLQQQSFSLPFRAARGYRPRYLLSELESEIQLIVCPAGRTLEPATRGHNKGMVSVHIGILKRLGPTATDGPDEGADENLDELDALMGLVNEIIAFLMPEDDVTRINSPSGCYDVKGATLEPAYDQRHLDEQRQFTSVLTVECELWQGRP